MKIMNMLPRVGAVIAIIIGFSACSEDFDGLNSNILGDQTLFDSLVSNYTVTAYSRKLLPVQTNIYNTTANAIQVPNTDKIYKLGVYNDPVYGKSTSELLSQLILQSPNPTFGDSVTLQKVTLYLPYYSTPTAAGDSTTYKLDSVYGSSPINISLFESNYFLREFDPSNGGDLKQKYYSNQDQVFDNFLGTPIATIENFVPNDDDYLINEGTKDSTRLAPGLFKELPLEYFQQKIFDKEGDPVLFTNTNFKDYLRGINFKVNSDSDDGSLFYFDIEKAEIDMTYSFYKASTQKRDTTSAKLLFRGVSVNTEKTNLPPQIQTAINSPNVTTGEETLYVRGGGDGIISVINLFGPDNDQNGVADELENLRTKKWLINEANLIFYVDQSQVQGGQSEPERLEVYNLRTNALLADFGMDLTANLPALDAIGVHLGRLKRGSDAKGEYYKIRITNYVSNLINGGIPNDPLGLVVSQNVLATRFLDLQNTQAPGTTSLPLGSVIAHEGTVLYGNMSANADKRLKLQIYYTESK